jgi:hypothetical protein
MRGFKPHRRIFEVSIADLRGLRARWILEMLGKVELGKVGIKGPGNEVSMLKPTFS